MLDIERRVLEAIDIDGLLAYLCELVAVPSESGQETAAQEHVAAQMEQLGLEVDLWQLDFDALSQHPAYSIEVERESGLGVVGVMGAVEGPALILNGHVDVVPAGDISSWQFPAWQGTISEGRVYGRGALDMKGGLCCALFAAKAIQDAGVSLKGRLIVESVIGEEDGGVGTLATIERGYTGDAAIIMEPTELAVAPAQAGALNFRVTVPGLAAHGSMRDEGVSAIEKFFPIYESLMAFEKTRNTDIDDPLFVDYRLPYAITIGTLRAGDWASTVAERLEFEGRFGIAVGESLPAAKRAFEEEIARTAWSDPWLREHPPLVEWWGGQFAPAHISPDHTLVTTVSDAFGELTGKHAVIRGMTYGADMRLLINEGRTPTILFGPGDVRKAHQPDEFVPISDLLTTVQTLALTALRFCGYENND